MQLGADSDTKEVEVTLSVSEAINLCHLKLCVSLCLQMCASGSQQLARNNAVYACVCLYPDLDDQ